MKTEVLESTKEANKDVVDLKLYRELRYLEDMFSQARSVKEMNAIKSMIEQLKLGRVRLIFDEKGNLKDFKRIYKARQVKENQE